MSNSELNTDLRIRVSEEKRRQIEEIAHERSEPGNQVPISVILREAIDEYLEDVDEETQAEEAQPAD